MPRIANTPVLGQADGPPWEFVVFVLVWSLLGLTSFLFFHFNRNTALKRRILPSFVIGVGALFLGVVYYFIGWQHPLVFVVRRSGGRRYFIYEYSHDAILRVMRKDTSSPATLLEAELLFALRCGTHTSLTMDGTGGRVPQL